MWPGSRRSSTHRSTKGVMVPATPKLCPCSGWPSMNSRNANLGRRRPRHGPPAAVEELRTRERRSLREIAAELAAAEHAGPATGKPRGAEAIRPARARQGGRMTHQDEQGYRIWVLPNWARRRVRKVSFHAARMRFPIMDSLEPSSLARL